MDNTGVRSSTLYDSTHEDGQGENPGWWYLISQPWRLSEIRMPLGMGVNMFELKGGVSPYGDVKDREILTFILQLEEILVCKECN